MLHSVCPWWMGYVLASPLRRLLQDPEKLLAPHVKEGMIVLEPGPGMGFFSLELARRVGSSGCVYGVDIQRKMLDGLMRRARKAGVAERIRPRLVSGASMEIDDLAGQIDFVPVIAVLHELPDAELFFREMFRALKPGGTLLLSEPAGHVPAKDWDESLRKAAAAGFQQDRTVAIRRSRSVLLVKPR